MKQLTNPWSAKRPDHHDPNVDYSQIHKLKDTPPYDSIFVTSHGIEAIRTQSEKFRAVNARRGPGSEYHTRKSYGHRIPGEKDARTSYGREYTRESSYNAYEEEDVNIEAEEFIQVEHQKLNFGRWMPTNSINYD